MADSIFMTIGEGRDVFIFSVMGTAYDSLQRSSAWRWAVQPRIGRLPGRQSLGPEDDTLELSGTVITERSGYGELTRLRSLMSAGKPQLLCDSLGHVLGLWCLESLQETQSFLHADGLPRKQTFLLRMSVYGEDNLQNMNWQGD